MARFHYLPDNPPAPAQVPGRRVAIQPRYQPKPTRPMVEVFKTNVRRRRHARMLLTRIHAAFAGYRANFDLDDCDRILRVECAGDAIRPGGLISLLHSAGFRAEVLPD